VTQVGARKLEMAEKNATTGSPSSLATSIAQSNAGLSHAALRPLHPVDDALRI